MKGLFVLITQFCRNEHLRSRRSDGFHDDFEKNIPCFEEIAPLLWTVLHQILSVDMVQNGLHRLAAKYPREHSYTQKVDADDLPFLRINRNVILKISRAIQVHRELKQTLCELLAGIKEELLKFTATQFHYIGQFFCVNFAEVEVIIFVDGQHYDPLRD